MTGREASLADIEWLRKQVGDFEPVMVVPKGSLQSATKARPKLRLVKDGSDA